MIVISVVELRDNLFDYIDKIIQGETVLIQHNQKKIAQLLPLPETDWRNNMKIRPELLVSPDDIIRLAGIMTQDNQSTPASSPG